MAFPLSLRETIEIAATMRAAGLRAANTRDLNATERAALLACLAVRGQHVLASKVLRYLAGEEPEGTVRRGP